mgnify:CR=1 FL=1
MSSFVSDLSRLNDNHAFSLLLFFFLIAPGIEVVLLFFPSALKELDVLKIIFLSASYSLVLSLPALLVLVSKYSVNVSESKKESGVVAALIIACATNLIISSIITAIAYYTHMSFHDFLTLACIVMVVAVPLALIAIPFAIRKKLV